MGNYTKQAKREINQIYRPATKNLNRQEKKIKSLDKKHARDENAYQNWLKDTNAQLNAGAAARDQQLATQQQGYQTQLQGALATADQYGGAFSGPGPPIPAGDDGRTAQVRAAAQNAPKAPLFDAMANAQSALAGSNLAGQQRRGLDLSMATEKNSYAQVALLKAQRKQQTLEAMMELAKQRGDLQMQKAAETAKRVADLEAAAAEAAQRAFENNMAIQQMNQAKYEFASQQALARDEFNLGRRTAKHGRRMDRLGLKLDRDKLRADQAAAAGKAEPTYGQAQIARARQAVSVADTLLNDRIGRGKIDKKLLEPKNWQALRNWLVRTSDGKITPEAATIAAAHHHGHGIKNVPDAWHTLVGAQANSR